MVENPILRDSKPIEILSNAHDDKNKVRMYADVYWCGVTAQGNGCPQLNGTPAIQSEVPPAGEALVCRTVL